jgi:hypothetical protein
MDNLSTGLVALGVSCRTVDSGKSRLLCNYFAFPVWLALRYICSLNKRPQWIVARSTDGIGVAILSRLFGFGTKTALHSHGWEEKAYQAEREAGPAAVSPKTTWKAHAIRFPLLRATLAMATCASAARLKKPGGSKIGTPHVPPAWYAYPTV